MFSFGRVILYQATYQNYIYNPHVATENCVSKLPVIFRCYRKKSSGDPRSWNRFHSHSVIRYVRGLHWIPIPLGIGFAYLAYQQFRHISKREQEKLKDDPYACLASDLEVSLYKMLPLRITSRWWGWINTWELPVWLRSPVLRLFISTYHCDLAEAEEENLRNYRNLGDFFRRGLKPGIRYIHPNSDLVSPVDGTILNFGKIADGKVEQIKGITYSLEGFLGPNNWTSTKTNDKPSHISQYQQSLLTSENDLYHCVVYLAPGDYHRFHSPVSWNVQYRRHFPGELLSVRPGIAGWIAGLFNMNERVVYTGSWKYGFFAMAAVGATNVGSIKVYFDKDLSTNNPIWKRECYYDCQFSANNNTGVYLQKGDPFGEFNLGSTIVIIFEAPKDFKFNVSPGEKIKYGSCISFHPS